MTNEKIAMNKFQGFCKFLKELNVSLTDNELYQSRYAYLEILKTMSDIAIKEQIKRIKSSKYYSLVIDESTDIANQKELMIYIKYFDDQDSEIKTEFLKLVNSFVPEHFSNFFNFYIYI